MKTSLLLLPPTLLMLLSGCKAHKSTPVAPTAPTLIEAPERPLIGGSVSALPQAVAYRTNGDYRLNVPLQMDAEGNIVSYPAPADVCNHEPLEMSDGWLLDRRGVNLRSVFTRYTYAEYCALPQAPSPDSLRAAIIPGARVIELRRLSLPLTEAIDSLLNR